MLAESALPDSADIRLLTEIGFLAAGRGDLARAEAIFGALALLRPRQASAHVGLAMALLNKGRFADAAATLERVTLPTGPERDLLGAVRGLALQLDRRTAEASRVLRAIASQPVATPPGPSDGMRLARRLLGDEAPPPSAEDSAAVPMPGQVPAFRP